MLVVGEVGKDEAAGGDCYFLGLAMLFVVWAPKSGGDVFLYTAVLLTA
jgi:hypothetical protein